MKLYIYLILFTLVFHFAGYSQNGILKVNGQQMTVAEALQIAAQKESAGDEKEASRYVDEVATYYWESKDYTKALDYYNKSLKLNSAIGNEVGIIAIYNNIAMIYADMREFNTSYEYFKKTLEGRKKRKDKVSIISADINISVVLNNLKKYDASIVYLLEALDLAREMNDAQQMRGCYGMLSETYEKVGNTDKAITYFNLYRTFHEMVEREKVETSNKQVYETRLQLQLAESEKENQELVLKLKQNELAEKDEKILEIDSTYKTLLANYSKKQLMLEVLKKDNELKTMKLSKESEMLKRERIIRYIFIVALIFLLFIIVLVIIGFIYKNKANKELKTKNEEIIKQSNEILKYSSELKESNATKDKFFGIIAHDLKNPFNVLMVMTELLVKSGDNYDKEKIQKYSNAINDSANHAYKLLENLLEWSRSQTGGIVFKPTRTNLAELITEGYMPTQTMCKAKNINIISNIPDNCYINADVNMIHTVVRNLVTNAIKYSYKDSIIEINVKKDVDQFIITVKDYGIGISKEDIQKLFRIDVKFSMTGTSNERGTGLGLILCKEFIEKHGGQLWVESQEDKGSEFKFTLRNNELTESQN